VTQTHTIDDDKSVTTTSTAPDISKVDYFGMCHQRNLIFFHRFLDIPASGLLTTAANRKNQKCLNTPVRLLEVGETLAKGR